jgi:hypothetical protein
MPFWIVETPRSIVDPTRHKHIIFGLNQPGGGIYVDGPFPTEGSWTYGQNRP